jgi:hypothetical protein
LETGASDVLVILPESGPEILIPFVNSFILRVDLNKHEIIVNLIPGMLVEEGLLERFWRLCSRIMVEGWKTYLG